ncbi:PREDICTED: uncharacterized protein LOC104799085 isoform X1 [Tarenaya hassleriana]|uniref:uncharacterized protein LOC104799085 isoform X2 n=1 Tax=Tarenaya hassleriana TaxID=28532 RepID=UPI00053C28A2|nr:PREDICTED: uncharacterized protein LOC104799085 isoform X2 [Tarenaya hassleriana]XP_019056307.1 PREDICTED: uncharacterized protein LOC104799085 isoform X1 [Tarenaya hassleriana]
MAKKREPKPHGQWTILEELLLVFAVKRHGSKNWDAIANELQSRGAIQRNYVSCSVITPETCRDEFLRLRYRFSGEMTAEADEEEVCPAPMLEELRQIRIEELRREVKQHDVSIALLESKIKRLEEESERRLTEKTDLRGGESERGELKPSPASLSGKLSASDKSNVRSPGDSIPTDQKPEVATASSDAKNDAVKERKPASTREPEGVTGTIPVILLTEPERDQGSSSRFTRNADNGEDRTDGGEVVTTSATREGRHGESNELRDSISESKREAAASKQSSDVQSSVTLSRRKRRRAGGCGASSDEEVVEIEEVSPAVRKKIAAVKPPESMVDLLRRIRSARFGSAFDRRLRIQESERYRKLIRQHMDLRTVKSRLEGGEYSEDSRTFYRDLLLLFNNAMVFYPRTSSRYTAAVELRALVVKEMKLRLRNRIPESVTKRKPSKIVITASGKRTVSSRMKGKENEQKKADNKDVKKERSSSNNNKKGSNISERTKMRVFGNNELSSHDAHAINTVNAKEVKKKKGAESFLRRMKKDLSTENEEEEEDDERDVSGSEVEEEVKGMKKEKGVMMRNTSSSSSLGKRVREENMKGKKKTGKAVREIAKETAGKRGKESNGEASSDGGKRGKKRARR